MIRSTGLPTAWSSIASIRKAQADRAFGGPAEGHAAQYQNLMAAIEQGIITPTTKARLMELEKEQSDIDRKITMAKLTSFLSTEISL